MMQRNNVNKNEKLKQLEYITLRVGEGEFLPCIVKSDRRCSANQLNCRDCVSLQKFPVPYSLQ